MLKSWVEHFLQFVLKGRFQDEVIGDLHEWYELESEKGRTTLLFIRYTWIVLRSLKPYQLKRGSELLWTITDFDMIGIDLKLGLRTLLKHSRFTMINALGLTSAFCTVIFIYAYVGFEQSYDRHHTNIDQIYRVLTWNEGSRHRSTPTPLKKAFQSAFGEELTFARFGQDPVFLSHGEARFYEEDFYWGDAELFEVFDLPLKYGNASEVLRSPNTIVLTEEVSDRLFGEGVNPIGRRLEVKVYDSNAELTMRIDGVLETLPTPTDLPFRALGSISNALDMYSQFSESWGFQWLHTYVMFPDVHLKQRVEEGLPDLISTHRGEDQRGRTSYVFQPLKDVHLHSADIARSHVDGDIANVRIFLVVGFLVFLIAAINYLNLTLARVPRRAHDTSVRKIHGAFPWQLARQLILESALLTAFCFLVALGVVILLWPVYLELVGKEVPLNSLFTMRFCLTALLVVLGTCLVAAIYPALVLSRMAPLMGLKSEASTNRRRNLRFLLVTFQFGISMFLLVSTGVIFGQLRYMINAELGLETSHLVDIKVEDRDLQSQIELLREEMGRLAVVESACISGEGLPSLMNNTWGFSWDAISEEEKHGIQIVAVDPGFFATVGLPLIEGKTFEKAYAQDSSRSVILNRTAWEKISMNRQLGMTVKIGGKERSVIGVAEDYHFRSFRSPHEPVAFLITRPGLRISPDHIFIKLRGENVMENLAQIEDLWERMAPGATFDLQFVDGAYQALYEKDQRFVKLFGLFAGLSILISCLGLLGVMLYVLSDKMKELSIRKVLGSSPLALIMLLGRQLGLMVLLGTILGIPVAIWSLRRWLEQFAFNAGIDPTVIIGAFVLTLLVACLTVANNVLKAITNNPVRYLRDE